ncbi:MAG: hypothetical protein WB679_26950 [Terracidiphilus sp.]
MVDSISNRDYALVQGCLLSIGTTCVLANLLTDVVYRWISAHEGMKVGDGMAMEGIDRFRVRESVAQSRGAALFRIRS